MQNAPKKPPKSDACDQHKADILRGFEPVASESLLAKLTGKGVGRKKMGQEARIKERNARAVVAPGTTSLIID